MRIGLIRHGETAWNAKGVLQGATDIPLNDRGQDQARDASKLLRGAGWDRIYSSPLARARQTADLIAEGAQIRAAGVLPGFIERSFGVLEGEPYWTRQHGRISLDHPSVERAESVRARALQCVEELEDRHPDSSTLVVAHGSVIRLLLDLFLVDRAPHINNLTLSIVERAVDARPTTDAPGATDMSVAPPLPRRIVTLANGFPLPPSASR